MNTDTRRRVEVDANTALIYVSRQAGICGPANETPRPATLADVDAWLETIEMRRTGDWTMTTAYDGLRLAADVELVERPVVTINVAEWVAPGADPSAPLMTARRRRNARAR